MPEIEADLAETLTPLGLEWTLTDQSVPEADGDPRLDVAITACSSCSGGTAAASCR